MAERIKVKPTSTEDPKFERKRQSGILKGAKSGSLTGKQSDALKAANTSKAADRGMPKKSRGQWYRDAAKRFLTKKTAAGRAKTKKDKTLGSIAKGG